MSKIEYILDNADANDPIVNQLLETINNYTKSMDTIDNSLNSITCFNIDIENYLAQDRVGIEPHTREKISSLAKEILQQLITAKKQVETLKQKVSAEYGAKVKQLT